MTGAPSLEDRARGALVGLAVGDALGAPLVGLYRDQARIKHGIVETFLGGGLYLLAPGETTGRVALVRAAAVALLEEDPSEERFLDGYLQVLASGLPGIGEATRASLERIRSGMPPAEAALEAHDVLERHSAGIGAALRAVPFALRFLGDRDAFEAAVLADASRTHHDPRARASALALATWVRVHLEGEGDPQASFDAVVDRLADRPELPDVMPAHAAVDGVPVRPTAFAPDVLHAAAHHLAHARSARAALIGAVNEAGEAAALGAAVGALAGARWGMSALPEGWTSLLRGAAAWTRLADRLLQRGTV